MAEECGDIRAPPWHGWDRSVPPIDHLATRVYSQNREVALLEWLSLSSYYYWGSFDIRDQNSSTECHQERASRQRAAQPGQGIHRE